MRGSAGIGVGVRAKEDRSHLPEPTYVRDAHAHRTHTDRQTYMRGHTTRTHAHTHTHTPTRTHTHTHTHAHSNSSAGQTNAQIHTHTHTHSLSLSQEYGQELLQALVETERAAAGQEHYHTAQACHDTASMSHFFRLVFVSFSLTSASLWQSARQDMA